MSILTWVGTAQPAGADAAPRGSDPGTAGGGEPTGLRTAAQALWTALDSAQRDTAAYAFDDDERFDLRLAPIRLEGLRVDSLEPAHKPRLYALLGSVLSPVGLAKVRTIMSLEREVMALESESTLRRAAQALFGLRGTERYYLTLYGDPASVGPLAFRFDGHHVSLNVTAVPGAVPASTPLFLGAQPREVPAPLERAGLRALAAEEDLARVLYTALPPALRERATLPYAADRALFLGAGRELALARPAGVPRAELPSAQQAALDRLIEVYLQNFAAPVAAARRDAIDAAGRDAIHFAWTGETTPGAPFYYRIQGPRFLIELDDTVPGGGHVHALYRDTDGDFGRDLLREHHAAHLH